MPEWVSPYSPASIKTESSSFSTLLPHPTHPDLPHPAEDSHILSRGEVQKRKHRQYMVEYRKNKKKSRLVEVQQLLSDDVDDEEEKADAAGSRGGGSNKQGDKEEEE